MNNNINNEQTERKICAVIGKSDFILPVYSGNMLFNVFDEYPGGSSLMTNDKERMREGNKR